MKVSTKAMMVNKVASEVKRRLSERGFKIIEKSSKKFWAVKPMTTTEIKVVVCEITTLMEVADLDGGIIKQVLRWSYALLNESATGAAGISIEI